jgi:acyl-CoA synthetase (NDP forming)
MVSQSGGISVMAHARAEEFGLGFRVTASCGNEAALGLADFVRALTDDDGTRVIAVYAEGLSDPDAFVDALSLARERSKPVVVLKGGMAEASTAPRSLTPGASPATTARSTRSAAARGDPRTFGEASRRMPAA